MVIGPGVRVTPAILQNGDSLLVLTSGICPRTNSQVIKTICGNIADTSSHINSIKESSLEEESEIIPLTPITNNSNYFEFL